MPDTLFDGGSRLVTCAFAAPGTALGQRLAVSLDKVTAITSPSGT
jgi:hypothetical protein